MWLCACVPPIGLHKNASEIGPRVCVFSHHPCDTVYISRCLVITTRVYTNIIYGSWCKQNLQKFPRNISMSTYVCHTPRDLDFETPAPCVF